MGVGLARGLEALNFRIIFQIMIYWVLTVPATALPYSLPLTHLTFNVDRYSYSLQTKFSKISKLLIIYVKSRLAPFL